ncbi:hypothetical protein NE237_015235 [Protea cynaroides]|uniref:UV radiation resistance-associated gene protein n=1 Tax=Protea cynaroides TaxID=273540 RepID=A0A9Q0QR15_9MAGN|nr:hypothetical protein NE237_015235 [Protea cynaroides]
MGVLLGTRTDGQGGVTSVQTDGQGVLLVCRQTGRGVLLVCELGTKGQGDFKRKKKGRPSKKKTPKTSPQMEKRRRDLGYGLFGGQKEVWPGRHGLAVERGRYGLGDGQKGGWPGRRTEGGMARRLAQEDAAAAGRLAQEDAVAAEKVRSHFVALLFMGSEKSLSSEAKVVDSSEDLKIIQWEDLEQELARLWSLSSALNKAKEKKSSLEQKLQSLIQLRAESLSRSNELEDRRQKLEARKLVMDNLLARSKLVAEDVKKREERLGVEITTLQVAGKALSIASMQLQEAKRLLAGERGLVHLKDLKRMLRKRQQYMIEQVSSLYPVKASIELTHGEKLDSSSNGSRSVKSGDSSGSKPLNPGPLTILGLQLTALPLKKASFFSDKKGVQKYATALGYVAHDVSLIASYLDVPLRYPLLFGGSRSYVNDYVSSVDPMPSDTTSSSLLATSSKPTEFPLFLEGQDITRAAYAIFLLNKDVEQLLNFIGVNSFGPRHVLANLNELLRTIQSPYYIDNV